MKALKIAEYVLYKSSKPLTNRQLQSVLYFLESTYQECKNKILDIDAILIDEEFEARYFGPAIPVVFYKYKKYGNKKIPRPKTCPRIPTCYKHYIDTELEYHDDKDRTFRSTKRSILKHALWRRLYKPYSYVIMPKHDMKLESRICNYNILNSISCLGTLLYNDDGVMRDFEEWEHKYSNKRKNICTNMLLK